MRQLFTWRFLAVVGALLALALLVDAIFADDEDIAAVLDPEQTSRDIDLIAPVLFAESSSDFAVRFDGRTSGIIDFVLDERRTVRVTADTPSDIDCEGLQGIDECAIFVDLLGDAVVWFAVRPKTDRATVELPPIVDLVDGVAVFENGWRIPFPPVIERVCEGEDIVSFRDFLRRFGPRSTSVVDLESQQVTQVRCAGNDAEPAPSNATVTTLRPALDAPLEGIGDETVDPIEE